MPSSCARRPVPFSTTEFIILIMSSGDLRAITCCGFGAVAIEAPDQFAGAGAHLERRMRRDRLAEIGEGGIGDGVLERVRPRRRRSAATACPAAASQMPKLRAV